jgi:hypothetical protein
MTSYAAQLTAHLDQIDTERSALARWPATVHRPEEVIEEDGYLTVVWHVGSPWDPRPEDHGIGHLLWMLTEHTLDPTFEEYGNFVQRDPEWLTMPPWRPEGMASISGNFYDYSCAFGLETNHPALIDLLEEAVRRNQATEGYQRARQELLDRKAAEVAEREAEEVARVAAQAEAQHAYEQAMRRRGF